LTLQSAWRGWCRGGGCVNYSVPKLLKLDALRYDFCQIQGLEFDHTFTAQVTHQLHRDIRKNITRAVPLDGSQSLECLGIQSGAVLDIIIDHAGLTRETNLISRNRAAAGIS